MNASDRVDRLDLDLFSAIESQTVKEERLGLLAVQRATANRFGTYRFLEIGSHLGGSIQPHLVDNRCRRIYSIDPRPVPVADDRSPGMVVRYEGNSTERMLGLLAKVDSEQITKIECFDSTAPEIDTARIVEPPEMCFIDGEHTHHAATLDAQFCLRVMHPQGVIVFHDFYFVTQAILDLCHELRRQGRDAFPLKLEGSLFAIFFDMKTVKNDPYLADFARRHGNYLQFRRTKNALLKILPKTLVRGLQSALGRIVSRIPK